MILLNEEITLHATFVTFVVETSRSQKKNIFKTSSPSHSYSHSYSCIVGRGICLFCAHSQFFFLSLSLLNWPQTTLLITQQQTRQSVPVFQAERKPSAEPLLQDSCEPTWLPYQWTQRTFWGPVSHIRRCDISSLAFYAWMDERSNVVSPRKLPEHILCMTGWEKDKCNESLFPRSLFLMHFIRWPEPS